jgi:predicted aconitase with swiveling domain
MERRVLIEGSAEGVALVLDEPISLWGGFDPATGRIVEVGHPQRGAHVTGRILVMPSGRGSSSSATVLAEAIRLGTAPAGIVLREVDEILAIGALAAAELFGATVPIVVVDARSYEAIRDGERVRL